MNPSEIGIGGIQIFSVIYGIVQLASDQGWISGQQKRVAALIVAAVLFTLYQVTQMQPAWASTITAVYSVIAWSFTASTAYDLSQIIAGRGRSGTNIESTGVVNVAPVADTQVNQPPGQPHS